ncbi:hypothetical protein [Streptomyces collinus]|uniref:hypothetical protein n=1 Tax=Streptomyces collinus TaxID=42684 RepID=UPI0033E385EC
MRSKLDLCEAMEQMWRAALFPSAREMERALQRYTRWTRRLGQPLSPIPDLGRTTLNTMRRSVQQDPPVLPKKVANFQAYVVARGQETKLGAWTEAWHRANQAPDED